MRLNLPVSGREVIVDDTANILSTTDLKGTISYANPDFVAISGFDEDELLGQPHNTVRHPDMPEAAFADLWRTLQANRSWMGIVKNRCKNGDHYWVSAFATPVSRNGKVVEYQSVRTRPQPEQIQAAEALHARMRDGRAAASLRPPALGLRARVALLAGLGGAAGAAIGALLGGAPLIAGATAVVLAGAAAAGLTALALAPLVQLVRQARRIGRNPVSQLIYTGRRDEIGEIAFAMKMLETEAGAMVGRIADCSRQLSEHARNLLGAMQGSTESASRQQRETDSISSVLDVIRGIAEQTNLLALNAAIEAARAGDHGRGFAVVASEVRVLAQKTQESTGDIQQMIANLQAGSDRAARSMQDTLGTVQTGASNVVRAGELLARIAEGVTGISDRNMQIASATEEQSLVAEDINRNVIQINDVAIQVSAGAEQTAATSLELARLAEQQQQLVGRFTLA